MTRRFVRFAFIVVLIVALLVIAAAAYFNLILSRLELSDFLARISSEALFFFLMILVVRHLILAVLAFIQHQRSMGEPVRPVECPPVSIIVPAFNEASVIEASIHSIMQLDYPDFEAIVVDDGSVDDTFEKASALAERYGPHRLRVLSQGNGGKARALNAGIAESRGELIVCSDADSRLEPDALLEAVKHFADPKVGAVAGNVKVVNRVNFLTRLQALEYIEGLNLVRTAQAFIGRVAVIPGPMGVFRRSVLSEVGGYHSDTYAEDCDLTLRIVVAGWKIKYESRAVSWTEAPEQSQALFKQRYRWGRGILQALVKQKMNLLSPAPDALSWLLLWTLVFETLALPAMDVVGMLLFVFAGLTGGLSPLIALWWAQLAVLDMVVALLCVSMEREDARLVLYAILYRLYYVPFVDTMRFFAWVDEIFDVQMGWLRLQRLGRT